MATSLHHEITPTPKESSGSSTITAPDRDPAPPLLPLECCVICLDQITDRATAIPCRHEQFDFTCLGTWLQRQQVCPLCKAEVAAIRFRTGGPTERETQIFHLPPPERSHTGRDERSTIPTYSQQQVLRRRYHGRNHNRHCRQTEGSSNATLDFRKQVYRDKLFSLHVGSNRISRYRNLTPASFTKDERLATRARMFIRRELQVFDFLNPSSAQPSTRLRSTDRRANNADFLLEYIIGILRSVDLKGSTGQAEELLRDFLGREHARIFLHELEAWLRSPYEHLKDWDRAVQYAVPSDEDEQADKAAGSSDSMRACRQSSSFRSRDAGATVPRWFSDGFVLGDQNARRNQR